MAIVGLRNLCTPAYVYLVISLITVFVIYLQNMYNVDVYCLGQYQCDTVSTTLIFIIKMLYVLFWTWILNLMCRAGASNVAWFLVILPYILMFALLFFYMLK